MTKEELKQEAEKSLDKRLGTYAYIRKQDCYTNYVDGYIDSAEPREKRIADLGKENAELKDGIALKDEEVGCIETDFNTFKSKAKEIITELLKYTDTEAVEMIKEAKQFLNEVEK